MGEPLPHKTPGQALRRSRIAAGASLREIAMHADLYPVQLGQLERDLLPDPDGELVAHAFYAVVGHLLGKLAAAHARIEELEGADHGRVLPARQGAGSGVGSATRNRGRESVRMNAYYYSFEPTGVEAIDRILSAVACAGKAYHHTREWADEDNAMDPWSGHEGRLPVEWIQNAANRAARELTGGDA